MKSAGIGMALFVALLTTRSFGQGTVLWDESVNGPISNSRFEPTSLGTFTLGTNSVLGTTDFQPSPTGGVVNPDYILLTVPSGSQISLLPFSSDRPVAVWLGDPGFGLELGSKINPSNADLLSQFGIGAIGAGSYGFYVMNVDFNGIPSYANYRFDFVVQTVPESSAWAFSLLGAAGWLLQNRWRRTRCKEQA